MRRLILNSRVAPTVHALRRWYWWVRRPITLGVKAVVKDQAGRVLLVRHTYQPGWHLPGGKVDRGESAHEAAVRELWEEVGLRGKISPNSLFGAYANPADFKHDHVLVFLVDSWDGDGLRLQEFEIAEAGFFAVASLPVGVTPATVRRLEELDGRRPKDSWW